MGDSGGTYTRSDGTRTGTTVFQQQEGAGLDIEASQLDAEANDMATALNNRLFKDGTNSPSAHLNWLSTERAINSTSGSSSNYTASLPNAPSSYFTGLNFKFRPNHTNTGTSTINVNSLGAKTIKLIEDTSGTKRNVLAGQLIQGYPAELYYDGTDFILINPPLGIPISWTLSESAGGGTLSSPSTSYANYWFTGVKTAAFTFRLNGTSASLTAVTCNLPFSVDSSRGDVFAAAYVISGTQTLCNANISGTSTLAIDADPTSGSFPDGSISFRVTGTLEAA